LDGAVDLQLTLNESTDQMRPSRPNSEPLGRPVRTRNDCEAKRSCALSCWSVDAMPSERREGKRREQFELAPCAPSSSASIVRQPSRTRVSVDLARKLRLPALTSLKFTTRDFAFTLSVREELSAPIEACNNLQNLCMELSCSLGLRPISLPSSIRSLSVTSSWINQALWRSVEGLAPSLVDLTLEWTKPLSQPLPSP
jgi:hypothetical protein